MKNRRKTRRRFFTGEPVVAGIAIGEAYLLSQSRIQIPKFWIHDGEVKTEIRRFHKSLTDCQAQLSQIKSKLCQIQGKEQITILDSHILLLQDELLVRNTVALIEDEHINAEWALDKAMGEIKKSFAKIDHAYLQERKFDIDYVENAIKKNLLGRDTERGFSVPKGAVVIAHDLAPAETLHLIRYQVSGFVTETGGTNSHTAIVARSLGIPYVFGVEDITHQAGPGQTVVVDGSHGRVILDPTPREMRVFRHNRAKEAATGRKMLREAKLKAETTDGHEVKIFANMEFVDEMDAITSCGTQGIGLYRTEFLFLGRETPPSMEEQEKIYRQVLKKMSPHEVTIRTLDLGAEKIKADSQYADQPNPALGLRAIRFCLRERKIFTDQIRALLKASTSGCLQICFPMISGLEEFKKAKKIVTDQILDMKKKGIRFSSHVKLGVMVETPSAVMEMDLLAREADFFSVGTNDLIQYLLAIDRTNELVSYLYTPLHPSVIRVLKQISDVAGQYSKPVTLCGEMAADPLYLLLIMALGFDHISMNAASIPRIKKMIRQAKFADSRVLLEKMLKGSSSKDNQRVIQAHMSEKFPEYFQ